MPIIDNKQELQRVFDTHQASVKDNYKASSLDSFINQYYDNLSATNDDDMHIELSKVETLTGRSIVIDW